MKTYQFLMYMMLCGGVTSETNGFNFQQPSSKWAFAQSYSWVVTNNGNNFDPQTQQSQEQAQIQQQMQQRTQQQQMQQLALQQQARQAAQTQQALQQQTLQAQIQQQMQQQMQQQALQAQVQQEAVENARQQREKQRFSSQPNSIRFYKTPNEPNGQVLRNFQTENKTPLSVRRNENTQEFIDEIVRKVIQQTRSALPTTREDIEKIVRKILLEDSSNKRDLNSDTNRMNRYLNNVQVSNDDQTNTNLNGLVETFNPSRYPTYPSTPTEQFNPRTECIVNCRDSEGNGQPIAIAMANAFFPPNRSNDPNMVANSFTYTSV